MGDTTKPKSATSYQQTAFGNLPRSKIVPLEQEGVKKALQHVVQLSKDNVQITPQNILDIHKVGFGHIFPVWAGKFRTVEVTVGLYEPPYFSRVPELVKNLCDDLQERLQHLPSQEKTEEFLAKVIELTAWFQHRFVWIHPFKDHNGRVARLLTNLLFLNLGFPIVSIKAETGIDREQYVAAMKAADNHDYSKLEELISQALRENLEKV